MRPVFIFITGFVLGFLLIEMISIIGFLLYDHIVGIKFFPVIFGTILTAVDWLLQRKSRSGIYKYKSSLR